MPNDDIRSGSETTAAEPNLRPDDPFCRLAEGFLMQEADQRDKPALTDIVDNLRATADMIRQFADGERIYRRPAERRRDLKSTFRLAAGLINRLNGLDPRSALSLMGSLQGSPASVTQYSVDDHEPQASAEPPDTITWGVTDKRLEEYGQLEEMLHRIRNNAWILSQRESPRRGAPQVSEAVVIGIPALAHVWRRFRTAPVSSSEKKGQFGLLAIQFFRLLHLFEDDAVVRTQLRRFVSDIQSGKRSS